MDGATKMPEPIIEPMIIVEAEKSPSRGGNFGASPMTPPPGRRMGKVQYIPTLPATRPIRKISPRPPRLTLRGDPLAEHHHVVAVFVVILQHPRLMVALFQIKLSCQVVRRQR